MGIFPDPRVVVKGPNANKDSRVLRQEHAIIMVVLAKTMRTTGWCAVDRQLTGAMSRLEP
jgi:hypothetical protein